MKRLTYFLPLVANFGETRKVDPTEKCGPLTSIYLLFLMSFKNPIIGNVCIILE